ncbi:flagellar export chaperone FliS [Candidatus Sumerlaeota bacterium]|nr:flagellar export chaperone FliS [Candidatus Sumerlaeota bacterium]
MYQQNAAKSLKNYHQTQLRTADRREIILYMYEGTIMHLNRSLNAVKQDNLPERSVNIGRAIDIMMELTCILDFEKGGEIAQNLCSLYSFSIQELMQANTTKDRKQALKGIRHSLSIMTTLRDAWDKMMHLTDPEKLTEEEKQNAGQQTIRNFYG